jgi:RNA polymerase sigma-70 factor (ECF subfamily)
MKDRDEDLFHKVFEELFHKYKRKVYLTAYQMLNNHEEANDILQGAFLRAYKSFRGFRKEAQFSTWIHRIAVNLCIDRIRRRRPQYTLDENIEIKGLESENPQKILEAKELHQSLTKALESLPPQQKAAIVLHTLQGLKHKEVAAILGCSPGAVKVNLYHGRKMLKEKLKEEMLI